MLPFPGARITTAYKARGRYWSLDKRNGLGLHTGSDLAAKQGTPIVACVGGKVVAITFDASYGHRVVIENTVDGQRGRDYYCHMPARTTFVKVGEHVATGQRIGTVGASGNVTGAHLHLERRISPYAFSLASFVNPQIILNVPGATDPPKGNAVTKGPLTDLDVACRTSGLKVVEISGWKTRGRPASTGGFSPRGIMAHHTGSKANGVGVASGTLVVGRMDLPGPLCQLSLDRQGTVYVVAAGRANHAGKARSVRFVRAGDGNTQTLGIEAQNSGSEGWTPIQLGAYHRLCAALCDHYGWPRSNVVGHGETSLTGKWDPGIRPGQMMDMNAFRAAVAAVRLDDTEDDMPTPEELWTWDGIETGDPANPNWQPRSVLTVLLRNSEKQQRQIDEILAWINDADSSTGEHEAPDPKAPEPGPEPEPEPSGTYTVQSGDWLSKIAAKFGASVDDLVAWNPAITNENDIFPGQVLRVSAPAGGGTPKG